MALFKIAFLKPVLATLRYLMIPCTLSGKYLCSLLYEFKLKYRYTVKLGHNELGYNKLGYNELGYNELGYNELGYNELGYKELGYKELGYKELGYKELGYKELGYNEHLEITNNLNSFGWFELFYGYIFPVITNKI
jgi:hypothetical protein